MIEQLTKDNILIEPAPEKVTIDDNKNVFDLIIIGAGPAGISALLTASCLRIKTLLITENIGGKLNIPSLITPFNIIDGFNPEDYIKQFKIYSERYMIPVKNNQRVISISKSGPMFKILTSLENIFLCKSIVFCTGTNFTIPSLILETDNLNFSNINILSQIKPITLLDKNTIIITKNVTRRLLSYHFNRYTKDILIVSDMSSDIISANLKKEFSEYSIDILFDSKLININKNELSLTNITKNENRSLKYDRLILDNISLPNSYPIVNICSLNNVKEIVIDKNNKTNLDGLFAAGFVTDINKKDFLISISEGRKAVYSAEKYILNYGG